MSIQVSDEGILDATTKICVTVFSIGGIVSDYQKFIQDTYATISALGTVVIVDEPKAAIIPATAAQIKKSISTDELTSFIDGKRYKTLKRHLGKHGLTPQDYRTQYGLPQDYPMVAPGYSAKRSELAKGMGLGTLKARFAEPATARTKKR